MAEKANQAKPNGRRRKAKTCIRPFFRGGCLPACLPAMWVPPPEPAFAGQSGEGCLPTRCLMQNEECASGAKWHTMCWGRGPCHARESRGCGGNPCGHGCGMHSSKADNIGLCQGPHSGSQSHNQDTS